MDINENHSQSGLSNGNLYNSLNEQYKKTGITYKSNEIICKISEVKCYPYALLIDVVKLFHMNQFEIIFFSHIINDEVCSYQMDPSIFEADIPVPDLIAIYNKITHGGEIQLRARHPKDLLHEEEEDEDEENQYWTLGELKKLYLYLLIIGYSVKYYLNESTSVYEKEMKRKYPEFFTRMFNIWVDKYSNRVLRTNPRKINQFYIGLFQAEEIINNENTEIDCQYRNYNEIVEEVIKATIEAEDVFEDKERERERDQQHN